MMQVHRDEPVSKKPERRLTTTTTDWPVVVFILGCMGFVVAMSAIVIWAFK